MLFLKQMRRFHGQTVGCGSQTKGCKRSRRRLLKLKKIRSKRTVSQEGGYEIKDVMEIIKVLEVKEDVEFKEILKVVDEV